MSDELVCGCGFGPPHPPPWSGACEHSRGWKLGYTPLRKRVLHLGLKADKRLSAEVVGNRWKNFYIDGRMVKPETENEIRLCFGHNLMRVPHLGVNRGPVHTVADGYELFDTWHDRRLAEATDDEL